FPRERGEPAARRFRLLAPELGQRHVDVAQLDVDLVRARFVGGIARDIALALSMPHQPQPGGPILPHCHPETAESTSNEIVPVPSAIQPPPLWPDASPGAFFARRCAGTWRAPGRRSGPYCN